MNSATYEDIKSSKLGVASRKLSNQPKDTAEPERP